MLFQDDILKLSVSVVGAQNGLNRVQKALDLKLLDVHPDKTGHVIIADDENRNKIEEELNKTPLKYNQYVIKQRKKAASYKCMNKLSKITNTSTICIFTLPK